MKLTFTFLFSLTLFITNAQIVFVGETPNAMIPYGNYETNEYVERFFGGHKGRTKELETTSDGKYLLFETSDVWTREYQMAKYDILNGSYTAVTFLPSAAYDIQLSDDDQYLFYHSTTKLYKLNVATMALEDSIVLTGSIGKLEVYDNNIVFCNTLNKTYKASFISHDFTETYIYDNGNLDLKFNSTKTKLYTVDEGPSSLIVLNTEPLSIDTVIPVNLTGRMDDILVDDNYIYLYAVGVGNGGTVEILDINDYSTVAQITTPNGYGKLNISPNNKLWIPSNTSAQITVVDLTTFLIDETISTSSWNNMNAPLEVAFSTVSLVKTGFENEMVSAIELYPNPCSESLAITNFKNVVSLSIYNSEGNMITSFNSLITNEIAINGKPGLYTAVIITTTGETISKTFIKN